MTVKYNIELKYSEHRGSPPRGRDFRVGVDIIHHDIYVIYILL